MNVPESESPVRPKSRLREQALQIIIAGMAYSTAFLIELLGRDELHTCSFWALVVFSLAVPLWMLSWTIHTQLDLVQKSKIKTWRGKYGYCMATAFVLSMVATGCELFRVMGWLFIGFEAVALWVLLQMVKIMDDHEPNTTTPDGEMDKTPDA